MDDLSFLTSGVTPDPADPLAFLNPEPTPAPEDSGLQFRQADEAQAQACEEVAIDEVGLAQAVAEAARSAASALEVELYLLWIKNPSNPNEARARVQYLEEEVSALEGNSRRLFVVRHKDVRAVLLENIEEYESVERAYVEKRAQYISLKNEVERLQKIRDAEELAAQKRAEVYAKFYS